MRTRNAGFSLLELVVAMGLVSFVLLSLVSVSASMLRFQMEGIRKGGVTGWSLISMGKISKELQDSNVLAWPSAASTTADTLVACTNWSRITGAKLDANVDVSVIYYCYEAGTAILRRYVNRGGGVTCPTTPPALPACNGSGGWTENDVLAVNVERLGGAAIFTRDDTVGGVWMRYVVGAQIPTTNRPTPVFVPFDFKVAMQKQYDTTGDWATVD